MPRHCTWVIPDSASCDKCWLPMLSASAKARYLPAMVANGWILLAPKWYLGRREPHKVAQSSISSWNLSQIHQFLLLIGRKNLKASPILKPLPSSLSEHFLAFQVLWHFAIRHAEISHVKLIDGRLSDANQRQSKVLTYPNGLTTWNSHKVCPTWP